MAASTVGLRAADADRERVVERLRQAQAEGRIGLAEFDERTGAAYAAVTYADLEPLTADLPGEGVAPDGGASSVESGHATSGRATSGAASGRAAWAGSAQRHAPALRIESAAWLFAGLVNVLIWAIVSVANGHALYPWWLWVVGPWGLVLLGRVVVARWLRAAGTRF